MTNNINNRSTELLAPAGGKEEFFAAINAGADAVYTGLKKFSARKSAKNITLEEAKEIISYAHLVGKKVYIAINTLIYDDELDKLKETIDKLVTYNPDGIIIQDIGLFFYMKNNYDSIELHASTQMTADNYYAFKNLYELGFERIVAAREMPLEELAQIKKDFHLSVEVFIHGALCVCYSGECYFSSAIGTRSANRGDCAQPCRKKYDIIVDGKYTGLTGFYLSMKDLNTGKNIESIEYVADSLKIEGRMKGKEYVYTVVNYYRKLIDDKKLSRNEELNVHDVFSRGFTSGFISQAPLLDMVNYDSPKHKGSFIGAVIKSGKKSLIYLEEDLSPGDGISYVLTDGRTAGIKIDKFYKKGQKLIVKLPLLKDSEVYRNYSSSLYNTTNSVGEPEKIPVTFEIKAEIGKNLVISMSTTKKIVTVTSDYLVQKAKKENKYKELFIEQLSRLGDSFFRAKDFIFDTKDPIFVPKSILNTMRRELVEKMMSETPAVERKRVFTHKCSSQDVLNKTYISLIVDKIPDPYILNKIKETKNIKEIKITVPDKKIFDFFLREGYQVVYKTPAILSKTEVEIIKEFIRTANIEVVEINSYALIDLNCKLIIGDSLNVMNSESLNFYKAFNIDSIIPSREISYSEIKSLKEKNSFNLRLPFYQHTISMITKTLGKPLIEAIEKHKNVYIRDSKNAMFRVKKEGNKYLIFNNRPLFMARRRDEIIDCILDIELDENFEQVIEYLYSDGEITFDYTTGHYRRGV